MGRFFEAVKAGVRGFKEANAPRGYSVAGRQVRCPHCGETDFSPGRALLNSRARSAFNVDWADPLAATLVCAECGRIEWFAAEPEEIEKSPRPNGPNPSVKSRSGRPAVKRR